MNNKVKEVYGKIIKDRKKYQKIHNEFDIKLKKELNKMPNYKKNNLIFNIDYQDINVIEKQKKNKLKLGDIFKDKIIKNWYEFIKIFIFDSYLLYNYSTISNYLSTIQFIPEDLNRNYTIIERYYYILISLILIQLSYLNKSKSKFHIYRGIEVPEKKFNKVFRTKDVLFTNSRFTSTSISPIVASSFHGKDNCCFLILNFPKNIPFIPISNYSFSPLIKEELEILLPPYLDYKVINFKNNISDIDIKGFYKEIKYDLEELLKELKDFVDKVSHEIGYFNYVFANINNKFQDINGKTYDLDTKVYIYDFLTNEKIYKKYFSDKELEKIKNKVEKFESLFF